MLCDYVNDLRHLVAIQKMIDDKKLLKKGTLLLLVPVALYGIGRLGVVMYDSYKYVDRQPYL